MRFRAALVLSLLVLVAARRSAADDLYKRPGHRGTLDGPPADVVVSGASSGSVPERLLCDIEFRVTGLAVQKVIDCQRADYVHLYQDALERARSYASTIRCTATCAPVYVFEVSRKTDCIDTEAYAEVTVTALCTNKEKPPQMARPTSSQLIEPMTVERTRHALRGDVYVTKRTGRPACPGTSYVRWRHVEYDFASCNDYSAVVSRAESESQAFYDLITCGPECKRTSEWVNSVVYTEWGCHELFSHEDLIVDIYMKVVCVPN